MGKGEGADMGKDQNLKKIENIKRTDNTTTPGSPPGIITTDVKERTIGNTIPKSPTKT